jgi:KaiC/GvpD/RAD55 family RecA-like ATPase
MTSIKDLDAESAVTHEVLYVGSFIQFPDIKKDKDFYTHRTVTSLKPSDMTDKFTKAIFEAVQIADWEKVPKYPNELANIMLRNGIVTPSQMSTDSENIAYNQLVNDLIAIGKRGAAYFAEFIKRERAMESIWRTQTLERLPFLLQAMTGKTAKKSEKEIIAFTREYLDNLDNKTHTQEVTAEWEEQEKAFKDIVIEKRSEVGRPLKTFPNHWGLRPFIPRIKPGWMIVISGATGDGKSALAMQYAEWQAVSGRKVLVIHMEDNLETILLRQCTRWIPDTTLEELERGDPKEKMAQMAQMRASWQAHGGEIIYKYLAGHTVQDMINQINEVAASFQMQGKHLDDVVIDYYQKADFETLAGQGNLSYVNVATKGAEDLKITTEKWNCNTLIVSQVTPDEKGGFHTAWARALEQKPQIYIQVNREVVKDLNSRDIVNLDNRQVVLADVGDRSVWIQFQIKKVNQGRTGRVWAIFEGPRFRAITPEFKTKIDMNPLEEFRIPILEAADDKFFVRQADMIRAYNLAYKLPNPENRRKQQKEENNARYQRGGEELP